MVGLSPFGLALPFCYTMTISDYNLYGQVRCAEFRKIFIGILSGGGAGDWELKEWASFIFKVSMSYIISFFLIKAWFLNKNV